MKNKIGFGADEIKAFRAVVASVEHILTKFKVRENPDALADLPPEWHALLLALNDTVGKFNDVIRFEMPRH